MAALTPQITLTANLESIIGGAFTGGFLRITLCGSGPIIPAVPGTCLLADATIPQITNAQVDAGHPITVKLFGNDVITPGPDVTFYEIAVLDSDENVIQSGNYRFDGVAAIDLSQAVQIVAPYGFFLGFLKVAHCTGAVPGNVYVAPGLVVGVFYNGALLGPAADYTLAPDRKTINLTFMTEIQNGVLDEISALCVVY